MGQLTNRSAHSPGAYDIRKVETTTSTQDDVRNLADPAHLTTVSAGEQSAGRGRLGRSWESGARQSLLASTFVALPDTDRMRERIGFLTLIGAAAMRAALAELTESDAFEVKFPNDVVIGGRKIAGVLGEFLPEHSEGRGDLCAAIGVGVNLTQGNNDLVEGATSLVTEGLESGAREDNTADRLLDVYLGHLSRRIDTFAKDADATELIAELNDHLYGRGGQATVVGRAGTVIGLNDEAHLVIQGDQTMTISPADVAMFVENGLPGRPSAN